MPTPKKEATKPASKSKDITVEFDSVSPKKNVYRFDSEEGSVITSIYVAKEAFGGKVPTSITVTVTPTF